METSNVAIEEVYLTPSNNIHDFIPVKYFYRLLRLMFRCLCERKEQYTYNMFPSNFILIYEIEI